MRATGASVVLTMIRVESAMRDNSSPCSDAERSTATARLGKTRVASQATLPGCKSLDPATAAACSSFLNASVIPLATCAWVLPSPSISSSSGGVCGAERSNCIVSAQSMDPSPGHRCVSLSFLLSCTCVERMWSFRIANAPATSLMMCACPTSKHTPTSSKCEVCSNSTSRSGVDSSLGMFSSRICHPERLGEGAQVLDRGHGRLELVLVEFLVADADVLYQVAIGHVLGHFDGALDLVHGINAALAVFSRDVQRRHIAAAPFVAVVHRRVHRVELRARALEPGGDFEHVLLALRVVEMSAEGEDLDRLRARARQSIQQARDAGARERMRMWTSL